MGQKKEKRLFWENSHPSRINGELRKQNEKREWMERQSHKGKTLPQWSEAKQFEYYTNSSGTTVNFFPVCFVATEFVLSDYSRVSPPPPPIPLSNQWTDLLPPVYCRLFPKMCTHQTKSETRISRSFCKLRQVTFRLSCLRACWNGVFKSRPRNRQLCLRYSHVFIIASRQMQAQNASSLVILHL